MYHVVNLKDVISKLSGFRKRFTCRLCRELFKSKQRVAAHVCIDSQGALTCVTLCPQGHKLSKWQGQVVFSDHKEWLCHICGGSFPDKHQLRKHVKDSCSNTEKKFKCEMEGCTFSTNYACHMRRHLDSRHLGPECPRPYVCDQCGVGFLHNYRLLSHKQDAHSREKVYRCKACPKVFYSRDTLKRHQYLHKNKAAFLCGHCGQAFSNKFNLKVHENIHTGQKPYRCSQCDAGFAQKNSLNVHMKKHQKEERVQGGSRPDTALSGQIASAVSGQIPSAVSGQMSSAFSGQIPSAVSGQMSSAFSGQISSAVGGQVSSAFSGQISSAVGGQMSSAFGGQVSNAVTVQPRKQFREDVAHTGVAQHNMTQGSVALGLPPQASSVGQHNVPQQGAPQQGAPQVSGLQGGVVQETLPPSSNSGVDAGFRPPTTTSTTTLFPPFTAFPPSLFY
ncbi:zinc finger protein 343-like [Littorina saxatilis]|uniref:zinc finger protein 343-like n=1 Tax=Littorina saxatilis TaxID=31220 RepID=UPI0038B5A716